MAILLVCPSQITTGRSATTPPRRRGGGPGVVAASTIFVFRKREPQERRSYQTVGYPLVPALFIATAAVLLYYTFVSNLRDSIAGLVVILLGVPVYLFFARQRGRVAR